MINYVTYAGTSLRTYNLFVNGRGTYNSPAKSYTMVKIPGRSGDLAYDDKKFENIDITYPAAFINPNFQTNFDNLKAFLYSQSGYQKLEDTYHPDEYRMAVFKSGLEVDVDMLNLFGTFDLVFHCKPQRFLKSGDVSTTYNRSGLQTSVQITNPTSFEAKPLIHVYGAGHVTIGSIRMVMYNSTVTDYYIDCEMMEAYKIESGAKVSVNNSFIVDGYVFPTLKPGVNNVSFGEVIQYSINGPTKIEVQPRWWTI